MTEAADTIRRYASRLEGTTHAVRWYRLFESIGLAPNREGVEEAVGNPLHRQKQSDVPARRFEREQSPLLMNIRREGIAV